MVGRRHSASSTPPRTEDPVLAALARAPVDDEPVGDAEAVAAEEAREAARRGNVVRHDEARKLLGI